MTAAVDSASPNFLAIRSLAAPPARWRASDPLALSKHGPPASHALPAVPEPQHPSRPSIHGNRRIARRDLRAPWPLPRHPGLMAQSAVTCRSATSRSLQFHGAMLARLSSRSRALGSAPDLAFSRPVQGPAIHRVHSSSPSDFGPFCRRRGTQSPALRLSKGAAHLGALVPPFPHGRSHSMAAHGVCHGAAPVPSTFGVLRPFTRHLRRQGVDPQALSRLLRGRDESPAARCVHRLGWARMPGVLRPGTPWVVLQLRSTSSPFATGHAT